jgi:ABC-type transporter Mla MlaB component
VVFSLFGKKSEPAKKKTESKPVLGKASAVKTTPAFAKPAGSANSGAVSQSGGDSLDFSSYTPPPKAEPPRAEAPPAALPPAVSQAPVSQAPAAAISTAAPSAEVAPVIEETAILFANGQVVQALSVLTRSVREADLGASALQAWLMLFDLYQHLGMRSEFEALALEFVMKFERSPSVWIETGESENPALLTGGVGYFALSDTLSEASVADLEKLRAAAATQQTVRVECAKLRGLDGPGCKLFRETLLAIRNAGKEVLLTGEAALLRPLEEACQAGKIETDGALWTLLLDVYRILRLKDKFEEAAVNYAVTFEVSPPSWDASAGTAAKRATRERPVDAADQALVLAGDITGASETLAKRLQDWAAVNKMLVIDMSRAKRVDFVTAGLMLNVLSKLEQAGITVQIRGPNELIHALFRVMGIGKVARIIPRK